MMIVNHEVRDGNFFEDGTIGDDFSISFYSNLKNIGDTWENDGVADFKTDGLSVFKR